MSFLPEWFSQGTTGQDSNGGFGTAAMFNQNPTRGDLSGLINALRNRFSAMPEKDNSPMPDMNSLPSFTPYQGDSMAPKMGQVNSPLQTSPNGQIMPNWNRSYGGY